MVDIAPDPELMADPDINTSHPLYSMFFFVVTIIYIMYMYSVKICT